MSHFGTTFKVLKLERRQIYPGMQQFQHLEFFPQKFTAANRFVLILTCFSFSFPQENGATGEADFCWRNLFSCINLLRVLQKLTKWKYSRTMVCDNLHGFYSIIMHFDRVNLRW